MRIIFFKCEKWEEEYLRSKGVFEDLDLEVFFIPEILDKHHIPDATDFEMISVFVDSKVDSEVIDKFPNLKLISTRSTGFDHVDLETSRSRGIKVSYVPTYGQDTVAEYTFALILSLSRKIFESYHRVREMGSFSLEGLRGFDLKGKTLGVVGTGNIGRNVIRIANGFAMNVIAHDIREDSELPKKLGFKYISFEDVLKNSDILTLHIPSVKETRCMLNDNTFMLMKKGALLINTSRGEIVDTQALVKALKIGHLGGAALDVLEEEGAIKDELNLLTEGHPEEHNLATILANHILIDMPNVIVTPHNAFNTTEALQRILDTTIRNIAGFIKGEPVNLVE